MTAAVAARLAWATLLMCCPRAVLRAAGDKDPDRSWLVAARMLGVRHVAQVWVERSGRPRRIEAVALVDGVHAVSAFGFGWYAKPHRRLAFTDAAVAALFALSALSVRSTHGR